MTPSAQDYVRAFRVIEAEMTPKQRAMLLAHYQAPGRSITATQLAWKVGYQSMGGANLQYGILARMVRDVLDFPQGRGLVHLYSLCTFIKAEHWIFVMRPQVARALELLEWLPR